MNFWQVIMTLVWFFFFVLWVFIVIMVFVDNFRRNDHGGWAKAGWTVLILFVPLIGVLIYLIARPKMTDQDKELIAEAETAAVVASGGSTADELERLTQLHADGSLSDDEFSAAKAKLLSE